MGVGHRNISDGDMNGVQSFLYIKKSHVMLCQVNGDGACVCTECLMLLLMH